MGGSGSGWGVRVKVNEIFEVFVQIEKKRFFLGGGGGVGGGGRWGGRGRVGGSEWM